VTFLTKFILCWLRSRQASCKDAIFLDNLLASIPAMLWYGRDKDVNCVRCCNREIHLLTQLSDCLIDVFGV
jgi:hypothetical protein